MPVIHVRPATLADADRIAHVHVRSWQAAYRGMMPQDYLDGLDPAKRAERWRSIMAQADPSRHGLLVATVTALPAATPAAPGTPAPAANGAIVGFASFGPSRDDDTDPQVTGEVSAIYADPDAWGTGAGRALMSAATAELTRLGYADAILWVLDANARARRFYGLAGWAEDGKAKVDGSRGFDLTEVRYRRTLA